MSLLDCLSALPNLISSRDGYKSASSSSGPVDLLLLGSGWTGSFVLPLAADAGLSTASTTRAGGNGTIKWEFDPQSDDIESYKVLPDAKTVLIIFPVYEEGGIERLVRGYLKSRVTDRDVAYRDEEKARDESIEEVDTRFILLGSTGIYDNGPTFAPPGHLGRIDPFKGHRKEKKKHHHRHQRGPSKPESHWIDNNSPYEPLPRAISEEHFLALAKPDNVVRKAPIATANLLLCGLWGHGRSVRNYMSRLPANKDAFRNLGSVHLVHGRDVGRAALAIQKDFDKATGKRWILTNLRVYDIWELASRFGSAGESGRDHAPTGPFPGIVSELMNEPDQPARALPRGPADLFAATGSKSLDGREFWHTFGLTPDSPWVD